MHRAVFALRSQSSSRLLVSRSHSVSKSDLRLALWGNLFVVRNQDDPCPGRPSKEAMVFMQAVPQRLHGHDVAAAIVITPATGLSFALHTLLPPGIHFRMLCEIYKAAISRGILNQISSGSCSRYRTKVKACCLHSITCGPLLRPATCPATCDISRVSMLCCHGP